MKYLLDKKWKWIAKDEDGTITVFTEKPILILREIEWGDYWYPVVAQGCCSKIISGLLDVKIKKTWKQSLRRINK